MTEPPTVGVIGLGAMGAAMVRRLLAQRFSVFIDSWPLSPTAELAAEGARIAGEPAAVAAHASVLITSLPGAGDVRSVLLGPAGVAAGAAPGTVVIDTSTIAPEAARSLAGDLRERGIGYLDAPVSGGPAAAAAGTLSVMVGGEAADLARARDVLDAIGSRVMHFGPSGAGQVCKACNQLAVMGTLEVVAETLVLARACGLDPGQVRQALLGGYAASQVLDAHGMRMIERDFTPGGKARYNAKDIEIIGALAEGAGLDLPAFAIAARQLSRLIDGGDGDLDNAAIVKLLEPRGPREHDELETV